MVRWFLAAGGVVFAGLGCVATLVHAHILDSMLAYYTIMLPPMVLNLPHKSILTDAAHGPPFLTFFGVFVLYFLPAIILLLWAGRSSPQAANREHR